MFYNPLRKSGDRPLRALGRRIPSYLLAATVFVAAMDIHRPAFAYLDPGTASIALQMLLGGVAGGLFVIKLYWRRIMSVFSGKRKDPETESPRSQE